MADSQVLFMTRYIFSWRLKMKTHSPYKGNHWNYENAFNKLKTYLAKTFNSYEIHQMNSHLWFLHLYPSNNSPNSQKTAQHDPIVRRRCPNLIFSH